MAGEELKVNNSTTTTDSTQLTDDEKKKIEQDRIAKETAAKNKTLTDAISGSGSKVELEANYQQIKNKKAIIQSEYNTTHDEVQGYQQNYSMSLPDRAKAGWAKLKQLEIYQNSLKMFNTFQTAYTNLTTYGDLKGVNIGTTGINDPTRLTSYVSNQEFSYGKQNTINQENYQTAVDEFNTANNNTNQADRTLTAGIDKERGFVDEMRFLDKQLQNNVIAQNYLA